MKSLAYMVLKMVGQVKNLSVRQSQILSDQMSCKVSATFVNTVGDIKAKLSKKKCL